MCKEIIITVHGTGDNDPELDGTRWWQKNTSEFTNGLLSLLGKDCYEIRPLQWSGVNDENERIKAANELADKIRNLSKAETPFHIIAHSHGGNIVLKALEICSVNKRIANLLTVINVGTPVYSSWSSGLNSISALRGAGHTVLWMLITYLLIYLFAFENQQEPFLRELLGVTPAFVIGVIVFFVKTLPSGASSTPDVGKEAIRRMKKSIDMEAETGKREYRGNYASALPDYPRILAIWHEDDEAMTALRSIFLLEKGIVPKDPIQNTHALDGWIGIPIALILSLVLVLGIKFLLPREILSDFADKNYAGYNTLLVVAVIALVIQLGMFTTGITAAILKAIKPVTNFFSNTFLDGFVSKAARARALGLSGNHSILGIYRGMGSAKYQIPSRPLNEYFQELLNKHVADNAPQTLKKLREELGMKILGTEPEKFRGCPRRFTSLSMV